MWETDKPITYWFLTDKTYEAITEERKVLKFKDPQMKVSFDIKAFKSQFETFQGRECLIEESKSW